MISSTGVAAKPRRPNSSRATDTRSSRVARACRSRSVLTSTGLNVQTERRSVTDYRSVKHNPEVLMPTMTGSSVTTHVGVRDVPAAIRDLTTIGAPDYVDLFTVDVPGAGDHSAEAWARAAFERTPLSRNARRLWRGMGLRLGPARSPGHIQGWVIAVRGDNWVRVETASWYVTAQAVCVVD